MPLSVVLVQLTPEEWAMAQQCDCDAGADDSGGGGGGGHGRARAALRSSCAGASATPRAMLIRQLDEVHMLLTGSSTIATYDKYHYESMTRLRSVYVEREADGTWAEVAALGLRSWLRRGAVGEYTEDDCTAASDDQRSLQHDSRSLMADHLVAEVHRLLSVEQFRCANKPSGRKRKRSLLTHSQSDEMDGAIIGRMSAQAVLNELRRRHVLHHCQPGDEYEARARLYLNVARMDAAPRQQHVASLDFLAVGGRRVGAFEYGPARLLSVDDVNRFATALDALSDVTFLPLQLQRLALQRSTGEAPPPPPSQPPQPPQTSTSSVTTDNATSAAATTVTNVASNVTNARDAAAADRDDEQQLTAAFGDLKAFVKRCAAHAAPILIYHVK